MRPIGALTEPVVLERVPDQGHVSVVVLEVVALVCWLVLPDVDRVNIRPKKQVLALILICNGRWLHRCLFKSLVQR